MRKLRFLTLAMFVLAVALAAHDQTYTVLYNMTGNSTGVWGPEWLSVFAQARDGNLYSTSQLGGTFGKGVIFRLTSDGNFYGTESDGLYIYKITPTGAFSRLFTLTLSTGDIVFAGLTQATDGKFYMASTDFGSGGVGTIFSLTTGGAPAVIHPFSLSTGFEQQFRYSSTPMESSTGTLLAVALVLNRAAFSTA